LILSAKAETAVCARNQSRQAVNEESEMAKEVLEELVINKEWCKGCGVCIRFCPKQVLELGQGDKAFVVRPEDYICCGLCQIRCPDLAIEIITESNKAKKQQAEITI